MWRWRMDTGHEDRRQQGTIINRPFCYSRKILMSTLLGYFLVYCDWGMMHFHEMVISRR